MFLKLFQKYVIPKNIVFTVILILFLVFLFKISDIAVMFFASFVMASSLNPLVDKLTEKLNWSRKISSSTVLLIVLLLTLALLIPTVIIAGNEIKSFAVSFPQYIDLIDDKLYEAFPLLKDIIAQPIDMDKLFSSLSVYAAQYLDNVVDIGKNVGSAFIYLIIALMLIFFLLCAEIIPQRGLMRGKFIKK